MTMVQGVILYEHGRVLAFNEETLKIELQEIATRLQAARGVN
jgi:hypothetical protein